MKIATLALALALPLPRALAQEGGAAPTEEPPALLQLADGELLWGRIVGHDSDRLQLERLDNGGRVALPWSRLDPALSEALRERFGYVDHSGEELQIDADKLVLVDGTTWIGRIVGRTADAIVLKTASATVPVPLLRLRGPATVVRVPALDVYTRDELYQEEAARLDPASAASHLELGKFCERILDFARAAAHYEKAAELDPSFQRGEIALRLARARVRAENQAQVDYLRSVEALRLRGRYDAALSKLGGFAETFPASPLAAEAARALTRVQKDRERALREAAVRSWHAWAVRLTQEKAREEDATLESSLAWLDEGASEAVLAAVHAELARTISESLQPDEVKRLWAQRPQGRPHRASYGLGTWLLGEEAAKKALVAEEGAEKKPKSELETERKKIEERMARYLKNQQMIKKAKQQEDESEDRERAWKELGSGARAQWLLAYYAESSGDVKVLRVLASACPECGGTGAREVIHTSANPAPSDPRAGGGQGGGSRAGGSSSSGRSLVKCATCRGIGFIRRVVYR